MEVDFENMMDAEVEGQTTEDAGQEQSVEERLQEIERMREELAKRERDLNKGFMEIAERERRIAELLESRSLGGSNDDDEDIPLSPESKEILDKFVTKKLSREIEPIIRAQEELYAETIENEIANAAEKFGVPEESIVEVLATTEMAPKDRSLKAARDVVYAAAKIAKAQSIDESEIERRVREKILKELAEQGATVAGVKPARQLPDERVPVDEMSARQRYEYYKSKLSQ